MNTLKKSSNDNNLAKLAVGKSLLKEYRTSECTRTVYLNDGDEFQIQLFNPETTEIGAEIFIDNEPLSNVIILNPGERMWLERYTDKAKKFKFKVYTVDGTSDVVEKAIAHNGEIKIKFYRKQKPIIIDTYKPRTYIYKEHIYEPWSTNIYWTNYSCSDNNSASTITCSCDAQSTLTATASCANGQTTGNAGKSRNKSTPKNGINSSINSVDTVLCDCVVNYCDSLVGSASAATSLSFVPEPAAFQYSEYDSSASSASFDSNADLDLIETGRVAEGSHSSQRFQEVNIDLEYWPFRTEEFKILPYSRKPYTANDAKKLYCPSCGRKLNTKFKFCPYCGEKID